jgi:drug/metabolite transporter (DMT)-like permease
MHDAERSPMTSGVAFAVLSAFSFGVTTPLIAACSAHVSPLATAALLYAGAAMLSIVTRPFAGRSGRALTRAALPRVVVISLFGAAIAPTLLVWGLARAGATASSLVLNFEAVFTVLLAALVHREHIGRRVSVAVSLILLGGVLVSLDHAHGLGAGGLLGLFAVLGATAAWALDNTLTRALADEDPADVIAAKGALGAIATASLGFALGGPAPSIRQALALVLCGATGYGLSLRLYLLAQRRIGAARTGSVFAAGPFIGATLAWILGDRQAGGLTALGAISLAGGVVLHLTERHSHRHVHDAIEHEHAHRHDDGHHDHAHEYPVVGEHTHPHRHERVEHEHEHAPDIHHGHSHR